MKSFGLALIIALVLGASCPSSVSAALLVAPIASHNGSFVRNAAYGDPPRAGRRGGGRKGRASKSVEPGVSSTKGVSPEEADKEYRKKYGF